MRKKNTAQRNSGENQKFRFRQRSLKTRLRNGHGGRRVLRRLFWTIDLSPKCHASVLTRKRQKEIVYVQRKWCEDGGREGSDVATSQEIPGAPRSC